jgi:serine O-acetyltransferase
MTEVTPLKFAALVNADWERLHVFAGQPAPRCGIVRKMLSPRYAPVGILRVAQRLHARRFHRLAKFFSFANYMIFGLEVPARLQIGPGLVIPHSIGTIIGAGYVGNNVTIYQQVTLGAKIADFGFDVASRPHVEDDVLITAGAKIIGPVRIGSGSVVGANAVVLEDVPPRHLAVGVPARAKPIRDQN